MRLHKRPNSLVKQVHQLIATLTLPRPWHLGTFTRQVAELVGKPIELAPIAGLTAKGFPCGVMLEGTQTIVVAYDADSSAFHIEHIILHELGHLLLDHTGCVSEQSTRNAVEILFPHFDPDNVLRVLGRSDYDNQIETQAELFASLIMYEARRRHPESSWEQAIFRS
ncbi:hypothetical protein [Nocardia sp. NBC_00511]|uniref:hypothetical protein n=1 Tax=Nocardia sp. NBC_00511 TaxID=2903591 RepID=UPI0030DF1A58